MIKKYITFLFLAISSLESLAAKKYLQSYTSGVNTKIIQQRRKEEKLKKLNTDLMLASKNGDTEAVRSLLTQGAHVNAHTTNGFKPIHFAVIYRNVHLLDLLVKYQANLNAQNDEGLTPLHYSVLFKPHIAILCKLLDNGAYVNTYDKYRCTALHYASEKESIQSMSILIGRGGRVDLRDKNGKTPLHYCCEKGKLAAAELLIRKKSYIDSEDNTLNTPLHSACKNGHIQIALFLIENGACIYKKNLEKKLH